MDARPAPDTLRYVSDTEPGWRRVRRGRGFAYLDTDGRPLRDAAEIARIRALAIPPAYEAVWICRWPDGHLQATGRDARGRKQYRYHALWHAQQGQSKYERLQDFGRALPALRRQVQRDLALPGLPRRKLLAALVQLLDTAYLRIGNDAYARENGSFGLTTLRRRHAAVRGSVLRLSFRGKGGVAQEVAVEDARLARIVRRCQSLPGQSLFHYVDEDGQVRDLGSGDVNAYLRAAMGDDFSAKDFRTWHASALALERLLACEAPPGVRALRQITRAVIGEVAARLGHTLTVCRQSYVHHAVLDGFAQGSLPALCRRVSTGGRGLLARERRLLALMAAHRRVQARAAAPRPAARRAAASAVQERSQ